MSNIINIIYKYVYDILYSKSENIVPYNFIIKPTKIQYYNTNELSIYGKYNNVSAWQGISYLGNSVYLICGTSKPNPQNGNGIIFVGSIDCEDGRTFMLNVPNPYIEDNYYHTSVYGPNYNSNSGLYTFVGSYTMTNFITKKTTTNGFIYRGGLNSIALNTTSNFYYLPKTLIKNYDITFLHSFSGNHFVGNSMNSETNKSVSYLCEFLPILTDGEPIYIKFPSAITTSSYGIWYNKNNEYTIVGGYSGEHHKGYGFIVDYNTMTKMFTNWTTVQYPENANFITHLQGIELIKFGVYSIIADVINTEKNIKTGYYLTIERNNVIERSSKSNGFIIHDNWININYPSTDEFTTSNSVANNCVVGLFISKDGNNESFQASIELDSSVDI